MSVELANGEEGNPQESRLSFQEAYQRVRRLTQRVEERIQAGSAEELRAFQEDLVQLLEALEVSPGLGKNALLPPGLSWFVHRLDQFFGRLDDILKVGVRKIRLVSVSSKPRQRWFDTVYTYQDAWAAEHLFRLRPSFFVDIGSTVSFVTLTSRVVPCVAVDVRPTPLNLEQLEYRIGEAQNLPFGDDSVPALSALNTVEHFGLGRYGDPLDPLGPERAFAEFRRVVEPGGWLLLSLPITRVPTLFFHELRAFSREQIAQQFSGYHLLDELYVGSQFGVLRDEEELSEEIRKNGLYYYCFLLQKPGASA